MADDYIRMACAELKAMNQPAPSGEQELNKNLLVVYLPGVLGYSVMLFFFDLFGFIST